MLQYKLEVHKWKIRKLTKKPRIFSLLKNDCVGFISTKPILWLYIEFVALLSFKFIHKRLFENRVLNFRNILLVQTEYPVSYDIWSAKGNDFYEPNNQMTMKLSSFVEQYFYETYLSCGWKTSKKKQLEKKPKKNKEHKDMEIWALLLIFESFFLTIFLPIFVFMKRRQIHILYFTLNIFYMTPSILNYADSNYLKYPMTVQCNTSCAFRVRSSYA